MQTTAFVILVLNSVSLINCGSDSFTEELFIKPLYTDHIYTHFHFSTIWDTDLQTEQFKHTHLFPRALGEIIKRHNVQELHLSLTAGLWRYETWGYPITSAPPGAELWVWFKQDTENVDKNWKELANSLSGLICASLNFIDTSNSISPEYSFRPNGAVADQTLNSSYLRYSALPREIVCTENLTPWKKLLPCESKKGLASLLNSGYIYNTRYHSLSIHFRPICRDLECDVTSIEVNQYVDLVYDYLILGVRNWSIRRLFGQGILGSCPLAKSSTVYVDMSTNSSIPFDLSPEPDEFVHSIRGGYTTKFAKYRVTNETLSISVSHLENSKVLINSPPVLHANQYLTGYGQELGGIVTKLYNNHWNNLDVVVLQNIPWYVPIYLHTLKIQANGETIKPISIRYIPGKLRKRPYYVEIALRLPPRSTTSISADFEHVFLKWTEYPPDASHGFYISSSVISAMLPLTKNITGLPQGASTIADSFNRSSGSGYFVQVHTETMVVTLPTPDFSMPYNVICLACTVVALAFGPLHNITTKRLILKPESNERVVDRLKQRLFLLVNKFKLGRAERAETE
ncbi:hypothetical protein PPYR_01934 [Photinus pyralis]|uniref:GPI transamidase component PIG-T n=1 Tax=Photinus pyralis TaxID=7054 RepID=A0A1Y1N965_PHOPY|nr:GPI transamidase component PIG-T-like [Photinus pyralis]XP_031344579.1 GPI transamidase component PIG-T-like [Photinus pyralis]KAB0797348.1 hypothetical protein PPYR_08342 [Photinus pyralis]KAB0804964.1 hypothetical protein PPYR_01934 [Photinus pyralis]